jgi:hypothetical protein
MDTPLMRGRGGGVPDIQGREGRDCQDDALDGGGACRAEAKWLKLWTQAAVQGTSTRKIGGPSNSTKTTAAPVTGRALRHDETRWG